MVLNDLLWSDTGSKTHRYQRKTENCTVYRKSGFTFVALHFETVEENVNLEGCGGTRTTSCRL